MHERSPREPSAPRRAIAILGGGFAGTAVAIGLLRRAMNVDVVLVDATARFARGVAYGTRDPLHLLNVPAGRMSLDPERPDAFVEWLHARGRPADAFDFVDRGTYGDYLQDALADAERVGDGTGTTLQRITATATGVERSATGEVLTLDNGQRLDVDAVVLALGPPAAQRLEELPDDPVMFDQPWSPGALAPLPAPGGHVLLVGSGLTAIDAAMRLTDDDQSVRVTMVSRHGLLPFAHLDGPLAPVAPPAWPDGPLALDVVAATVRAHVDAVVADGHDWRAAIDALRPQLPVIWHRLGVDGQRRFLREHAREWEVRRHRMAPRVATRIAELRAEHRLVVSTGSVASAQPEDGRLRIELDGATCDQSLVVDRLIACTGPSSDPVADGPSIIHELLETGRAQLDALGLGLRANAVGQLVDAVGTPSPSLWLLGALRRGELWETTAVPEIREQAARIAESIHAGSND